MTDRGDGDDAGYLLEVTVSVSREKAEIALARLLRVCPGGVLERRGSEGDVDYVLFFSSGAEVPPLPGMEVKSRLIPQVDWEEQARRHFHPVEVGPLRIIAPWMAKRDERDLVIEPGVAFGTGGHESTRLALELLVEALAEGPVDSLLDVGCGTGILALAALRLGVPRAWACDVDAAAVRAARRNSKANDLEAHLKVSNLDVAGVSSGGFPLVLANINAPTIISRSNSLARLTAPWGELIISGIYGEQVEPVIAALRESFEELSRAREGDWYGVRLVRGED